jgi:single-strand DNA-binding protein
MQFNRIQVAGYLATEPEIRYLAKGTKVAQVNLGESYWFKRDGAPEKHTNWHRLVFYGELADVAEAYKQGWNIMIEGNVNQRKFTGRDGEKTVHEIVVRRSFRVMDKEPVADPAGEQEPETADVWPA